VIDHDAFRVGLGREVRALRARRGLTQARLAARIPKMTANTVGELEAGRSNPSVTRVMQLADALGVASAELVASAERNAARGQQ
jgi:transcriptional regulator with XRE-family HTH domain